MRKIAPALGALGLAVPISCAMALGTDSFVVSANAERRMDSNVFRIPDNVSPELAVGESGRSDDITRLGIGARFDHTYGLQRLIANAHLGKHDYARFDQLDHSTHGLTGEWHWGYGEIWSGLLSHNRQRYLAELVDIRTKDMVTERRTHAGASMHFHPRWSLGGSVNYASAERSTLKVFEHDDVRTELHLNYVGSPGNSIGVSGAWTRIDYPRRQRVGNMLIENSQSVFGLQGTVDWAVTGNSRLSGGLGMQRVEFEEGENRNFDGVAGRLTHAWQLTGKTHLTTALWREVTTNNNLSSNVLTEGWSVTPVWVYSPKVGVEVSARREEQEYRSPTLNDVFGRQDTVTAYSARVMYGVLRNVSMDLSYERGDRDSTLELGKYRYHAWMVGVRTAF